MALALARKYRPRTFSQVAVQSHVSNTLRGAIARGRVAHGYLLCGPRGVGKTTLARVLAMALNCDRRNDPSADGATGREPGEPCGECGTCQRIWSGSASLDVVEIDAASNRGVDDARDLRERAMYAPSGDDRYKVYIVDEAHMLTREAWNALLKILEEPPPRVVFVFATTEPQKIAQSAAPVLSRLQRFDFKRMSAGDIRQRLVEILAAEGMEAEPDALSTIARAADGSMRDALSLTDQVLSLGAGAVSVERVREALGLVAEDEFIAILDIIAERRAADVFPAVSRLADAGLDFGAFLGGLADILRAQLAITLGGEPTGVSERARGELEARRDRLSAGDLLRMLTALGELEPRFRKSGQQQMLLETMLVRFALLDRSIDLEEVLRGLGGDGEGAGRSAGAATTRGRSSGGQDQPRRAASSAPSPERTSVLSESPAQPERSAEVRATPAREEPRTGRPERSIPDDPRSPRMTAGSLESTVGIASAVRVAGPGGRGDDDGHGSSATAVADAPVRTIPVADVPAAPEITTLTERWDEIVDRVRTSGRATLTAALQHALPVAVTARGVVTVQLDEANEILARAFEAGRDEVAATVREVFPGVTRVMLTLPDGAPGPVPVRVTEESLRADRLAHLRRRDPSLDAAIDMLDLELLD